MHRLVNQVGFIGPLPLYDETIDRALASWWGRARRPAPAPGVASAARTGSHGEGACIIHDESVADSKEAVRDLATVVGERLRTVTGPV
jgi:hypothetical protein